MNSTYHGLGYDGDVEASNDLYVIGSSPPKPMLCESSPDIVSNEPVILITLPMPIDLKHLFPKPVVNLIAVKPVLCGVSLMGVELDCPAAIHHQLPKIRASRDHGYSVESYSAELFYRHFGDAISMLGDELSLLRGEIAGQGDLMLRALVNQ